jgi:hypothetical protein
VPATSTDSLFELVVDKSRLAPGFTALMASRGYAPSRAMMDRVYAEMGDRDGNFREQFQTTGFDARTWELYLYAALTSAGYGVDPAHAVPDFVLEGHGHRWSIEATTANPASGATTPAPTDPGARQRYVEHELPIRLGSPLYSKLTKRYWEKRHVAGAPFAIALESFATGDALEFSETTVSEYLFGIRTIWERAPDGRLVIHNVPIAEHRIDDKVIPSGFFSLPDAAHLSAVLFSNQGTVAKFGRMAYQEGLESKGLRMVRKGLRARLDPQASEPAEFEYEVGTRWEPWSEGLIVIHNPRALDPLPEDALPQATHYRRDGDDIITTSPPFHAFMSKTLTLVLH